ncbi:hypothetical protein [Actinacidiphila glaucinigra]|uniref:hypothetical protein n=1 Tax=Actinacidiphila glaucinigra TaxID=235986 RepID=UPI003D940A5F
MPFVDDSHIPLEDPHAIEAVGRNVGAGMWGRYDGDVHGEWRAFTTDPFKHDAAWVVRYHPTHGRSVLLVPGEDASAWHLDWFGAPVLFRAGGYWWDGKTWYRPAQVWDSASRAFDRRPVPGAVTVTAADLLDATADAQRGRLIKVLNFDHSIPQDGMWLDDLALWAHHRIENGTVPVALDACVVDLAAPELARGQMVDADGLAEIAGVSAATMAAYLADADGGLPAPQSTATGRSTWSRPVVLDWAERRCRSSHGVTAAVSGADGLTVGAAELRDHFANVFFLMLSAQTEAESQDARRPATARDVADVRRTAEALGRRVAEDTDRLVPVHDLAVVLQIALMSEFDRSRESPGVSRGVGIGEGLGMSPWSGRMLGWFIRHHPAAAWETIGEFIGQAEHHLNVPRRVTMDALRVGLARDGAMDPAILATYLERALPPRRDAEGGRRDEPHPVLSKAPSALTIAGAAQMSGVLSR